MAEKRPDGTTRGGHEPPDDAQDRPEQNAGYDKAARGARNATPRDEDFVAAQDDPASPDVADDLDDRAARDAADAVRRRERSAG
jgi:hypothetical protein